MKLIHIYIIYIYLFGVLWYLHLQDVKLLNPSTWITCLPKESMVSHPLCWVFIYMYIYISTCSEILGHKPFANLVWIGHIRYPYLHLGMMRTASGPIQTWTHMACWPPTYSSKFGAKIVWCLIQYTSVYYNSSVYSWVPEQWSCHTLGCFPK